MIDVNAYLGHFAFRQLRHNTGAGLVKLMDRFGIERAVVSSAAAITYRNCQAGNEETAAEVEGQRKRLIPFAVLNPTYAGWEDDLRTCQERYGMKGVRLYPRWHNYSLADARCRALAEAAAARKMTVAIPIRVEDRRQGGWLVDIPDVELQEIAGLVKACPQTRFLIQNAGGISGSALGNRAAGIPANFAVEVTRIPVEFSNELARTIDLLGEDRVLLGTGMPFHYPGPALVRVEILQASDALKQKIRKTNAERWLGLAS